MKKPQCLICRKDIGASIKRTDETDDEFLETSRSCPDNAVIFTGGTNFGSTVVDALVDGIEFEIIICDDCLKERMDLIERIRYHRTCEKVYVGDDNEKEAE